MQMRSAWAAWAVLCLLVAATSAAWSQWTVTLDRPGGKDPHIYAWVPDGCKLVRGVLVAQPTMFEERITKNDEVRAACAEKGIAVVYAACGIGLRFITEPGGKNMEEILAAVAKGTNHPELEFAPILTVGHSTGGIYCRNVAYWQPERVAGVMHVMSGNLQAHVEDYNRSLAGVPILFVNGEIEQYGPDGGDLKSGLRSIFSLNPTDKTKENQTQWICMRQQIIARRMKNENNVMGLIASRNCNHTTWEAPMNGMLAQFIRSVADLRIPKTDPDGKTIVKCLPVKASQGWLLDADIKAPKFQPAPYAEYKGDKRYTLWFPDQAMAMKVWAYNQQGWDRPDPTADWPAEKRYTPEERLQDIVDSPAPPKMTWIGGDGAWNAEAPTWTDAQGVRKPYPAVERVWRRLLGKSGYQTTQQATTWNAQAQAIFAGTGGTVTASDKVVCSGLTLGKGYTLALGTNAVDSRWFITLEPGSTLEVTLDPKEANGRWGARVWAAGNAQFAGTLILKGTDLKEGTYNIIRASGKTDGHFDKVICPEGWTTADNGGSITLKKVAG